MQGALDVALELAAQKPELAPRMLAALHREFALRISTRSASRCRSSWASREPSDKGCAGFLAPTSRTSPSRSRGSTFRQHCYTRRTTAPRRAWDELRRFEGRGAEPLVPPEK